MLDADDAILEQAMQTGAALKRARDLQKAARKPKVITHPLKLPGYCLLLFNNVWHTSHQHIHMCACDLRHIKPLLSCNHFYFKT